MSRFVPIDPTRRIFLGSVALSLTGFGVGSSFADELLKTPAQTEGPFYPNKLPLDTDNDLIVINEGITPAVGEITHLTGRVLDLKGKPINNALVEIWQCDNKGVYLHTGDSDRKKAILDANFQGFGRFLTSRKGEYYFRTIKPVPYPGRTPHIHVMVKRGGKELLTTQCYIQGHPMNNRDGIYRSLRTVEERKALTVDFTPIKESKVGELAAHFDIILGITPET